jgi:hypothetical protein
MITVGRCSPTTSGFLQRLQQLVRASMSMLRPAPVVVAPVSFTRRFRSSSRCLRGLDAGVGHQQGGLQLLVERLVDRAPVKTWLMLEPVLRRPGAQPLEIQSCGLGRPARPRDGPGRENFSGATAHQASGARVGAVPAAWWRRARGGCRREWGRFAAEED